MECVYAALLLHKLGKPVDEENMNKVLSASGATVDESKVKSLVASLKDVNIDEELEKAVVASAAPAASAEGGVAEEKAEEPKEEKKEAAAEGLSALFG
jgi:large subunit ribosomal protein L12